MRKVKIVLAAVVMAVSSLVAFASPAGAVVCHDEPGMCCEDPTILGKEYNFWDC